MVRNDRNPFRVNNEIMDDPQGSRSSNPGLKLANAFGVKSNRVRSSIA